MLYGDRSKPCSPDSLIVRAHAAAPIAIDEAPPEPQRAANITAN
jgi:hypothetical protein